MKENKIEFALPDGKKVRLDLALAEKLNLIEYVREEIKGFKCGDVVVIEDELHYIHYCGDWKYAASRHPGHSANGTQLELSAFIDYLNRVKATIIGNVAEDFKKVLATFQDRMPKTN